MSDLRQLLSEDTLRALRSDWDGKRMNEAMLDAMNQVYPPLAPWNASITDMFFSESAPLAAIDRERCLIALLTLTGPQPSLAIHVYIGLMEGLTVDEICHVVALSANYGGVPRLAESLPTVRRALLAMRSASAAGAAPARVLTAILDEFRVSR